MDTAAFNQALVEMTDYLASLAGAIALHRTKLVNEFHFSEASAEAMCVHVHMRMVEMMCTNPYAHR